MLLKPVYTAVLGKTVMGVVFNCERALIWDAGQKCMRPGFRLELSLVGQAGTVFIQKVGYSYSLAELPQRKQDLLDAFLTSLGIFDGQPALPTGGDFRTAGIQRR